MFGPAHKCIFITMTDRNYSYNSHDINYTTFNNLRTDISGFDGHKANKFLRNNDFELDILFPGALHIAQGFVVTGQFMMYF